MSLLLYFATALAVLWLVHSHVVPMSRAAGLLLLALPLAVTGYALVTGGVYGPVDHVYQYEPHVALAQRFGTGAAKNVTVADIWSEFFPWRLAVKESLARREWPLWNAYNLAGHPLAAEAQSAPYSPFTLIACLLPATVSMTYTAAIALFLAAVSAFVLARELGLGEAAACVAAAGWALSSCMVVSSLNALGFATLYAPLLLAAARRVVWQPALHAGALLMTALALSALAGHPESLLLNVLVGCAYGLFELVRRRASPWRAIATALAAGLAAFLLCAIALLPLLDAIPQSHEYGVKTIASSWGAATPEALALLMTNFFPFLQNRAWLSPLLGHVGGESGTTGSVILALSLYAIWRIRSAETWFFAALAMFCFAAAVRWTPLADAMHALPLLSITFHDRLAFHGALALAILAAMGVDFLIRREDWRGAAMTCALVLLLLAAGTWWIQRNVVLAVTPADHGRYRMLAELLFLGAAAALLWTRPRALAPALLAVVVAQRALSEIDTYATVPRQAAYPPIALFEPLTKIRQPFRIVGRGLTFPPATNIFYGLEDPRGYDALTLWQFVATWRLWCRLEGIWFNRVDDLSAPFLSLMNVRFAIQPSALPLPDGWRPVASQPGSVLIENSAVIERIFIPRRVVLTGASIEELVDRMARVRDFREIAWITSRETGEYENGPGKISLRSRSRGGLYELEADMERPGHIVISDCAWRGWQAFVDGTRVPLERANAAFLAVRVPAGRHQVLLVYRPRSFLAGRAISALTLMILLAVAWFARRRA